MTAFPTREPSTFRVLRLHLAEEDLHPRRLQVAPPERVVGPEADRLHPVHRQAHLRRERPRLGLRLQAAVRVPASLAEARLHNPCVRGI
jgi:hypothetical protein